MSPGARETHVESGPSEATPEAWPLVESLLKHFVEGSGANRTAKALAGGADSKLCYSVAIKVRSDHCSAELVTGFDPTGNPG